MLGASRSSPARPSGKAEVNKVAGQIKDKTETRLARDRTKNGAQGKDPTVKTRQVQNRDKGDGASGNNNRTETKQARDKTVTKSAQDRTKDGARGKDKTTDAGQVLHQDQDKTKARQVLQEENKTKVGQKQNANTATDVSQVKDENLNRVAHVEGREVNEDGQVENEKEVMEVRSGVNAEAVVNSREENDAGEVKGDVGKVQENSTLWGGKDKTSDDLGEVKDHQKDRPAINDQLNHDSELVNDATGGSVQGSNGTSGGKQVRVGKAGQQPGQVEENLNNAARQNNRKITLRQLMNVNVNNIEMAHEQPAVGDLAREKTTEVKDTLGDSPQVGLHRDPEVRETNSYVTQEEQDVDEKTRNENQWEYEGGEAKQHANTRTDKQETENQINRNVAHKANNSDENEAGGPAEEDMKENANMRLRIGNEHHNGHTATRKTDETVTATKTRIRHKQDESKGRQDDEASDDLDCGDLLVVDNELVRHLLPYMSPDLLPKPAKPCCKARYSSGASSKEDNKDKEASLNIIQESSENEEDEGSEDSDQELPALPPPASLSSLRRHSFHHFPAPPPESGSKKAEKVRALLQAVEEEELEKISKKIKQGADLVRQHLGHVEDRLFDMFGDREKRSININKFLMGLTATGMRPSDPRLKQTRDNLRKLQDNLGSEFVTLEVDYDSFMSIISENLEVVVRAFSASFVIPDFQGFCRQIEEIYNMCYANHSGRSAQYIPQLARFDSRTWGVSVCTVDGQRFSLGDVDVPFTIQSCSYALTYAVAVGLLGTRAVHTCVGMEPSGRYHNELCLDYDNKPHNPMINSGAIMTAAIIKPELSAADRFDFMFKVYKRLAGDEHLGFNNSVFLSERECADRNFALAYFMRENKCFPVNHKLHESLDFYFQLCSLEITAESGAVMAATLANGGLNPLTGDPVLTVDAVRNTLTLMHSCGMYNYSGQFAFHVGLPAKSGVSGCVLLVIPNTMGICLWSPPLDSNGNSCRGVQFCMEMVSRFNFHNFDNLRGYAKSKKDPRTAKTESKAQIIFDLLFSSAAGDMSALRRHSLAGTDMQAKDYDGRTALHVATSEGHHEIVEFLLNKCQVDPLPKDRWDRTPLDDAESFDHPKCAKLITECCKRKGITLPLSYNECMTLGKESNLPLLEIDSL